MKKKIEVITVGNHAEDNKVSSEEKLLDVLNNSGLNGLEKLKRIGPSKAKKILKGREDGLYTSVNDLERIGMSQKAIQSFVNDNVH